MYYLLNPFIPYVKVDYPYKVHERLTDYYKNVSKEVMSLLNDKLLVEMSIKRSSSFSSKYLLLVLSPSSFLMLISVACAIGPSVTTSSTDFSFQNLVFWNLFEFQ
jgi:hypothetical protein